MIRIRRKRITLLLATAALLLVTGAALAQTGDGYDLSWWTVDSGGYAVSSGEGYTFGGTIGQPDAGMMSNSSGTYMLSGGFWGGAGPVEYEIYLPLVLRGS